MRILFQLTMKSAFRDIYLLLWSLLMPAAGIVLLGNLIQEASYRSRITIGMMTVSVVFYAFSVTAYLIMAQRRRGLYHLLKVTAIRPWEYVSSISSAWILTAVICGLIVFLVGVIAFAIPISVFSAAMMLPILFVGAGGYICLSFYIAGKARNEAHLSMLTNVLILPLLFCSDGFYSLDKAPNFIKGIQAINPIQWFINAASGTLSMDLQVYCSGLLFLVIFFAGMFALALKSFREV